jgi:hypothetical protein
MSVSALSETGFAASQRGIVPALTVLIKPLAPVTPALVLVLALILSPAALLAQEAAGESGQAGFPWAVLF